MVSAIASVLLLAAGTGGFVTPMHAITPAGYVWPMADLFHDAMDTPHPQGARVLAAAGTTSSTAFILGHDGNVEIYTYGNNGQADTMNDTDAPREMAQGTLKMWAVNYGQFYVQSDSKKAAWMFDPVKYWRTVEYNEGLVNLTPYGQGAVKLLSKKPVVATTAAGAPAVVDPAVAKANKKKKAPQMTRFVYYPITNEAEISAVTDPPTDDFVYSIELPDGLLATGILPTVAPGVVILNTGKRAFVYSLADRKLISEIATNGKANATLAFSGNQCYAITFGTGRRPTIAALTLSDVVASDK